MPERLSLNFTHRMMLSISNATQDPSLTLHEKRSVKKDCAHDQYFQDGYNAKGGGENNSLYIFVSFPSFTAF